MLASLIQHYNAMLSDGFSTQNSPLMWKLVEAVVQVEDVEVTQALAQLRLWSEEVQAGFIAKNAVALGCGPSSSDLVAHLHQSSLVQTQVYARIDHLTKQVATLTTALASISDSLQGVAVAVGEAASPSTPSPKRKKLRTSSEGSSEGGVAPMAEGAEVTNMFQSGLPLPKSSGSSASSKQTKKDQPITWPKVNNFLEELSLSDQLDTMGSSSYSFKSEKKKIRAAMAYLKTTINKAEWVVLRAKGVGEDDNTKNLSLKKVCLDIFSRARGDVVKELNRGGGNSKHVGGERQGLVWSLVSMGGFCIDLEKKALRDKSDMLRAQAEVQLKAEAEAQLKAEAETQLKAEAGAAVGLNVNEHVKSKAADLEEEERQKQKLINSRMSKRGFLSLFQSGNK